MAATTALMMLGAASFGCGRHPEPAPAPDPAAPLRNWPEPAGWRSETLAFPLPFAPELAHRGLAELRFAPGMFSPDAPGYWSYAFVWWLEDRDRQDAASLGADLTTYFRGLLGDVAKQKAPSTDPAFDPAAVSCTVRADGTRGSWSKFRGEAAVVDTFGDRRPLKLNLQISQRDVPRMNRRAVVVLVSPAEPGRPIWQQLETVGSTFAPCLPPGCRGAAGPERPNASRGQANARHPTP